MASNNINDLLDKATKQQEKQKQKPVTMNQLFSILKEQGQSWRDEHVKVLKNGEERIQKEKETICGNSGDIHRGRIYGRDGKKRKRMQDNKREYKAVFALWLDHRPM